MRKVPASSIVSFFSIQFVAVIVSLAISVYTCRALGLASINVMHFVIWFMSFSVIVLGSYKYFLHISDFPAGDVPPGSRLDYVYNVYVLFGIFYFRPISFSNLVPAPFTAVWYRLLGAKIGRGTYPSNSILADPPFTYIGDDCVLGVQSVITPHLMTGNDLRHENVVIGNGVTIGIQSIIYGDVVIGDGSLVLAHSSVVPGTRIGKNEMWGGNPARKIKDLSPD